MKFLKNIILFLLLFATALTTKAQTQFLGSSTTTVVNKGAFVADSILKVPLRDTVFPSWLGSSYRRGTVVHRIADSLMYQYNGSRWQRIGNIHTLNTFSTTLQNLRDRNGNTTPLQLATNRIALGSGTISGTSLLNFPDAGTTAADGISFGTSGQIFRSSSLGDLTYQGIQSHIFRVGGNSILALYAGSAEFGRSALINAPNLTGSSATSALSITQTYNTTGNPTLIYANVTNTASGISSKLMDLQVGGITLFTIDKNGNVTGASSNMTNYTTFSTTSVGYFGFGAARSRLYSPADGIILLQNAGGTDFNRLQFGGTTSSFPSLKRSSANLQVRLADDSGFTGFEASTITGTQYRLSALNTAPSSASDTGTLGEIRVDANFIYICTATNTWKRVAIATW